MERKTKWQYLKQDIRDSRISYVMLAPYFILFFIFTVLPVAASVVISFTDFNMLEAPNFVGWKNYIKLMLDDDVFKKALKNTLVFAVITGPLSYIMCFLFAWVINEFRGKLRAFLTLIFYAPSIAGNAFMVWSIIISGERYGYLNGLLMKWGFIYEPIQWMQTEKYVLPMLIVVQLWLSLGTGFLTFIAGLQTVDKSLFEAGAMDGIKNRWQELWYITLPSMKPQLMFGAVMQITSSLSVSQLSIDLVGFPSVSYAGHTILTHLHDFGNVRYELGYACTIAVILFFIMLFCNIIVQKMLRKLG